jgi:hypothetical protein
MPGAGLGSRDSFTCRHLDSTRIAEFPPISESSSGIPLMTRRIDAPYVATRIPPRRSWTVGEEGPW